MVCLCLSNSHLLVKSPSNVPLPEAGQKTPTSAKIIFGMLADVNHKFPSRWFRRDKTPVLEIIGNGDMLSSHRTVRIGQAESISFRIRWNS